MFTVSARAHAHAVTQTASLLEVALPATYLEQVSQTEAFSDAVNRIAVHAEDLHNAVFAAIEAGKDYHDDPDVARLLLDRQLTSQNISERARSRADQQLAAALSEDADDILHSWADALAPHTAALVAAADANLDLNNADAVVARGGDDMQLLHDAQTAAQAWALGVRGFCALATVSSISLAGGAGELVLTPARLADLAPAYDLARSQRTDIDAWVLVRCRIPLRLATIGEFMDRAATFKADREAAERAEVKRREDAVQQSW